MASVSPEATFTSIGDPLLLNAMSEAIFHCLAMGDISVRCVAMSNIPTREVGEITGLIGVHGEVTGYVTVNMSGPVAIDLVGSLLMEKFQTLDHQVIDGVGELTNMIAGGIKKGLAGTSWAFSDVTVPSVIVGQNYDIAFAQGFHYLSMTFEHTECPSLLVRDRLLNVSVSLFRR